MRKRGKTGDIKRDEGIHRHDISGEARERIKELLPGQAGKHGRAAKDSRLFINAAKLPFPCSDAGALVYALWS
ncbi:hypothetical protein [Treponema endosymbiont of Eucomonympha sp.]|uniref:hypothetical protein n=1 Tax=Treponema endosymbiont of Eucomonympha sp. TaxID=1580831 RepID=UPI000750D064|nr:hypothetical protein [Treponema endosymbiont of Eucomonympha sp.]